MNKYILSKNTKDGQFDFGEYNTPEEAEQAKKELETSGEKDLYIWIV